MGKERKPHRRPMVPEDILARVKKLAQERKVRALSRDDLARAGIQPRDVTRSFGSHNALIEACGLEPRPRRVGLPDETLLVAMHKTFSKAGGLLSGRNFNRVSLHGREAYKSRWRSWSGALRAYRDWLHRHQPDCPHMAEVERRCQESGERAPGPAAWRGCGGARLGAPLGSGALQHAPTNEMGVVLLFGALAPSLGYIVEIVRAAFPDCMAKRRLREPNEPWERVRIEFEFKSSNFRRHRHDVKKCDVIVCWEHDWPDCPLEVLELKRKVLDTPHPKLAS